MATINQRNQSVLNDDRIGRLLLTLSLPTFFGMFISTLYNVVDTIFIGHYVGPLGIAGLSIVFPLQMLLMAIGDMTGMGGASLISRSIGAGDKARAERTLGNALTINIVLAVIMMVAGLANPDFWLRLIGASETILPYARDFMTIIFSGAVFSALSMALNSLIRAEGNARIPMTGMIIGAVTNVILCAIFIIPLDMGVKGSALATVIAQLVCVIFFMSYYFSGKSYLKIRLRDLAIKWKILKEIFAIGIASFSRLMAASLSAIFVNRMLIAYSGDLAISAFGIINRIMMFAIMPGIAIGGGMQPIVGFNHGAKRYDRALRAIKIALLVATACCLGVFIVLYFAPEPFIRIFTNDAELIALSTYAVKRVFLSIYLIGFIMVGSLVFQAVGKATQAFVTAVSRPFLFLIPLVFILPRFLGLDGVWLAFPIADGFTLLLTLMLLIPQIREMRRKDSLVRETLVVP